MIRQQNEGEKAQQQAQGSPKLPYQAPTLKAYGSVQSLTKGNIGTRTDGQSPNPRAV